MPTATVEPRDERGLRVVGAARQRPAATIGRAVERPGQDDPVGGVDDHAGPSAARDEPAMLPRS